MKERMRWKSWLRIVAGIACGCLAFVAGFNYFFDRSGIVRNSIAQEMGGALARGENVAGPENIDDRVMHSTVVLTAGKARRLVILGSSRVMQLRCASFGLTSGECFNHGVSGASLEDLMAITGEYVKHSVLPQFIVIGVDPWIFNRNSKQSRWRSLSGQFAFMRSLVMGKPGVEHEDGLYKWRKYLQLLNVEILLANVRSLRTSRETFRTVTDLTADAFIRSSDGSIYYPHRLRNVSVDDAEAQARKLLIPPIYSLEGFDRLDNVELFEAFIHYLRKERVTVIFMLLPYHPAVWNGLVGNEKYAMIQGAEKYLKAYAKREGIPLVGSYDPSLGSFGKEDFHDGIHLREGAYASLIEGMQHYVPLLE